MNKEIGNKTEKIFRIQIGSFYLEICKVIDRYFSWKQLIRGLEKMDKEKI